MAVGARTESAVGVELAGSKTSPSDSQDFMEGYRYYCGLCDEVLVLSRRLILPRRICRVFETCPSCGFELERVLRCEASIIPRGRDMFTSPRSTVAEDLVQIHREFAPRISRASALRRGFKADLTTGIEALDTAVSLRFGQFAALQGPASHDLSLLLCVRATLPSPLGPDSGVMFIDGGNLFDPYAISKYARQHELNGRSVLERVHLSRAFTFHQLHSLVTEKLPTAMEEFGARFAVVSDITQLYSDPDIRDKQEARDIFAKTVRFLGEVAEQKDALVLATALQPRDHHLDRVLLHTARVLGELQSRAMSTRLTLPGTSFQSQKL